MRSKKYQELENKEVNAEVAGEDVTTTKTEGNAQGSDSILIKLSM